MAKIKLTESELKRIVTESVQEILQELDWRTYDSARAKAQEKADNTDNRYEKQRRQNQAKDFTKASSDRYTKQYGLEDFDKNETERGSRVPSNGELKRAAKRSDDTVAYYREKQHYKDGKWQDK
jgi:HD-GYP domain-containing protein (c-di-GMP phosphodiesterase class II)